MQCSHCNAENTPGAAFCGQCGSPLVASTTPQTSTIPQASTGGDLSDNAASAIAYITIIPAIIFLLLAPYNQRPLVRFHSFQSIGFGVAAFVLQVVLQIVLFVFISIASSVLGVFALGIGLTYALQLFLGLALFVVWIALVIKASKGEWFKLPIIGDFAEKQAKGL